MEHDKDTALFRAHAAARLTGDTVEAVRLAAQIDDEQRMHHLLFTLTLFTQFVVEELGYEPDPDDLAALTKRLHDKYFQPGGTFEALRAEAMVRAVTTEPVLLYEIPSAEQASYMWAAIDHLADKSMTEDELTERFELAEEAQTEMVGHALRSPTFTPPQPKAAQADPAAEGAGADPDTEAPDAEPGTEAVSGGGGTAGPPLQTGPVQHAPARHAPVQEGTEQ